MFSLWTVTAHDEYIDESGEDKLNDESCQGDHSEDNAKSGIWWIQCQTVQKT